MISYLILQMSSSAPPPVGPLRSGWVPPHFNTSIPLLVDTLEKVNPASSSVNGRIAL